MNNTARPRLNLSVKTKFIQTLRAMKQYNNNIFDSVEGVAYPKLQEQYPKISEQLQIHAGKGDIDSINRLLSNEIDFETVFPAILTAATFGHADTMQHLMQFLTPWLTLTAITTQPENERSILHDIDQWLSNAMQEYNAKSIAIKKDTLTICMASSGLITTIPYTIEVETGKMLPKAIIDQYNLCPDGYSGLQKGLITQGKTAITLAAGIGNAITLRNLLSQLSGQSNYQRQLYQAFYLASIYGQDQLVAWLIEQGVDIDRPSGSKNDNLSALHWATRYGQELVVKQLLAFGTNIEQKTSAGSTALMFASGPVLIGIKHELPNPITLRNALNRFGDTALYCEKIHKKKVIVEILLAHCANPNVSDIKSNTPLHYAAQEGNMEIVRLLLVAGANPTIRNNWNRTALDIARLRNHPEVTTVLEEFQANTVTSNSLNMFASNTTQPTSSSLTTNRPRK